jgi:geranylgeranyl diphosphate synthase type I
MATASQDLDLATLIADTEAEILRLVGDQDASTRGLYEMVRYHLALDGSGASGGKRIRPLLGLLAYASITGDHRRALPGAAAVELGHNFSLVHDDIEDGDIERRHRATLWTIHGVPQAINTGDALFSLSRIALHRLTDLGFPDAKVLRLMRLFDQTCLRLCEGQYLDIEMSRSDDLMTVELYFDMIGRKTAALIAASIESGALLATDDEGVIRRYHEFGWALGIAFQLNDDLLGIWGAEQATGKEPSDVAHKKKTLPVIYAYEHAAPGDRARLAALYALPDPTPTDVAEIIAILERAGAREYTRDEAHRYRDKALAELDAAGVIEPAARDHLKGIIVSVINA